MTRDLALIDRLERLHPAVVSDCLDRIGHRAQVLAPHIRPLSRDTKVAGYASTVHCVDVDAVPPDRDDWYRGELSAVDALEPGDVMVVSTCRGSYWGELLATASRHRGARGVVADAYTRDTLALIEDRIAKDGDFLRPSTCPLADLHTDAAVVGNYVCVLGRRAADQAAG